MGNTVDSNEDPYAGRAGSWLQDGDQLIVIEQPTQDHPEGNRARAADGTPLDVPAVPAEEPPPDADILSGSTDR